MNQKSLAEKTREMQREVILEQAAKLFAEEGPRAVTMRKIAQKSKTSTMVLYSLFGNKTGVIEELFLQAFLQFQKKVQRLDNTQDKFQFLLSLCEMLWDFSIDKPNHYRMMHGNLFPGFSPLQMKDKIPEPRPADLACEALQSLIEEGRFQGLTADDVMKTIYSLAIGLINTNLNGVFPDGPFGKEKFLSLIGWQLRALADAKPATTKDKK